jgi:eukaryotic-like serine/threonine-protein kinase
MDERVLPKEPGDPRRLGPYELLGRLGQGGMGVVHLGRQRRGGRLAAVKALRPELAGDPGFAARFRREVEAARRVDSPRVARVLGAEPGGPRPWLATEYVDGPTLAAAVEAGGPLAGERLAGFAAGVAEALAAIHAAGVVHRDLKPGNVLLDGPDLGGSTGLGVKVIDFGIAWAADATMTRSGLRFGTPSWMAPERLRDQPAGPAADVFAWGALVAFAATGRHPFGGGPPEAVAYRILHDPPDLTGVPASLRPLVETALARDPAARPSATRLATVLTAANSPTRPLPASGPTRVLPDAEPGDAPPAGPGRVLPVTGPGGAPSADPTRRRRRRRARPLLVALVLLAGLVATPQLVAVAAGSGGDDPTGRATAKVCPDDRKEDDRDRAAAADDDEDGDDDEKRADDEDRAMTDRDDQAEDDGDAAPEKRQDRASPRGGAGQAPTVGRPAPPTTHPPAPATTHHQPVPTDPDPTPPDPVLGS